MPLPPLPSEVFSVLGPVPVVEEEMDGLLGEFIPSDRLIRIHPHQCAAQAYQTLFHEIVHLALRDSGVGEQLADIGLEEAVCDAIGTHFAASFISSVAQGGTPNVVPHLLGSPAEHQGDDEEPAP